MTPELLSPIYSRSVPARSGCVRCLVPDRQWHPSLEGPINLLARRSIPHHQRRRPTKPWYSPPHRSRAVSRDFVHWCFSYACRRRVRIGSSCRLRKASQLRTALRGAFDPKRPSSSARAVRRRYSCLRVGTEFSCPRCSQSTSVTRCQPCNNRIRGPRSRHPMTTLISGWKKLTDHGPSLGSKRRTR